MKYEPKLFNPPSWSQELFLYEEKIAEYQNKIKNIYKFVGQLQASSLHKMANEMIEEAQEQEKKMNALIMSPQALIIPRRVHHG